MRRTLVVAPHPDDETLGCGALIARLRQRKADVRVLIVTDGRHSHRSKMVTPDQLAEIRAGEVRDACAVLGVPANQVRLLSFEDGDLAEREEELRARLSRELQAFNPEQILYPSGIDLHADHRAIAAAIEHLLTARNPTAEAYAYPVWFWEFDLWLKGPHPIVRLRTLDAVKVSTRGGLQQKKTALAAHRSQFENLTGEPGWHYLSFKFIRHFLGGYELFFKFHPPRADAR